MRSKRKGKEIKGSGSGAGKKQSTVSNQGIHFQDDKQRSMYKSLISKHISACRYLDTNVMDRYCRMMKVYVEMIIVEW